MWPPRLSLRLRAGNDDLGEVEQEAELDGLEQVGVEALALVLDRDVL